MQVRINYIISTIDNDNDNEKKYDNDSEKQIFFLPWYLANIIPFTYASWILTHIYDLVICALCTMLLGQCPNRLVSVADRPTMGHIFQ